MTGTADTEAVEFDKIYKLDVVVDPHQQDDDPHRLTRTWSTRPSARSSTPSSRRSRSATTRASRSWSARSRSRRPSGRRRCSRSAASRTTCSTPSTTSARPRSWPRPAARARSPSPPTWPAAAPTSCSAATPSSWPSTRSAPSPTRPMEGEADEAFQARRAEWATRLADAHRRSSRCRPPGSTTRWSAAGGLHILGTERHESRRIDNQLRGRAGRQGDPGVRRFFLSLEDDLMRIFGAERIAKLDGALGMEEGEPIEHRLVTRAIESAQKKVEAHNFDIRKHLLEYDDVMNQQRKSVYRLRRMVLGFGAGVPVVEYDEEPKTKKKTRREQVYGWEDAREHMLDLIDDLVREMVGDCCPELPQGMGPRGPVTPGEGPVRRRHDLRRSEHLQGRRRAGRAGGSDLPGGAAGSTKAEGGALRRRRRRGAAPAALRAVPLPPVDRRALEGPPAADGPPAAGHRPARLRPAGSRSRSTRRKATTCSPA